MNYFNYIKKSLPLYLGSGIILALSVFSLLMVHKYNDHLDDTASVITDISQRKTIVKNEIKRTDDLIKYLRDDLDVDMTRANPERLIFRALDDIKSNFHNAVITVSRFDETGSNNELPVEIEAGMKDYKMVLDYVAYIESFRIPDFEIRHISISEGQAGGIVLKITGVLAIPPSDAPA
jgi:hypothetical protein